MRLRLQRAEGPPVAIAGTTAADIHLTMDSRNGEETGGLHFVLNILQFNRGRIHLNLERSAELRIKPDILGIGVAVPASPSAATSQLPLGGSRRLL